MLSIQHLSKAYERLVIFDDFSIDFVSKRSCLVGANGSGKSSLLCMISGVLDCTSGRFAFNNAPLSHEQVAIASDSIVMPSFISARDVLQLCVKTWDCTWPDSLIAGFNFAPHLDKNIADLSAGNVKKLQLINAVMRSPSILLLDEPNIALDPASAAFLWDVIDSFNGLIVAASNEPEAFSKQGFMLYQMQDNQHA